MSCIPGFERNVVDVKPYVDENILSVEKFLGKNVKMIKCNDLIVKSVLDRISGFKPGYIVKYPSQSKIMS